MLVPAVVAAGLRAEQLDELHASLHHAPRQQALAREDARGLVLGVQAVELAHFLCLAVEGHQVRHARLHGECQLRVVDGTLERIGATGARGERLVHVPREIKHFPLPARLQRAMHVGHAIALRAEQAALVRRRQEAVAEELAPAGRDEPTVDHHEVRQIVARVAQAVRHPRAHARAAHDAGARVQEVVGIGVLVELAGHRAHHAEVVRAARHVREERRHLEPALAVARELPRAAKRGAVVVELRGLHAGGERLAVPLRERGLRVERVHLRRTAVHVEEDHAARGGREVRAGHARGSGRASRAGCTSPCTQAPGRFRRTHHLREHARKRRGTEAARAATQHVSTGDGVGLELAAVHEWWRLSARIGTPRKAGSRGPGRSRRWHPGRRSRRPWIRPGRPPRSIPRPPWLGARRPPRTWRARRPP